MGQGGIRTYDATTVRDVLTCDTGCQGLDSSATTNTEVKGSKKPKVDPVELALPTEGTATGFVDGYSDLFVTSNSSDASELAFVNAVTGGGFMSGTKTDGGGASTFDFISNALYILFKIGSEPNVTIVKNLAYGTAFSFEQVGQGAGLSHFTEFGEYEDPNGGVTPSPVPVPAALPLMLGGFGLAGVVLRRKKRNA